MYYSVKTNYLPALCRQLAGRGLGADVVSGYELSAALAAGFAADDIVFNGPVKTADEIEAAVRRRVRINIDGPDEIDRIASVARRIDAYPEVGLRVSPGRPVSTSADPSYRAQAISTARRNRFGWPVGSAQLAQIVDQIGKADRLRLTAVHAHLSSQIVHEALFLEALEPVLDEAAALRSRFPLREVNIGGGFGVPGIQRPRGDAPLDLEPAVDLGRLLAGVDRGLAERGLTDLTLACEPGRWLVSDAMATVMRVRVRKELPEARWLIVDAGNNVAPWTGSGERHRIVSIGRDFSGAQSRWSVAGPLCYENDIHGLDIDLPDDVRPGDLLCLHDTGAYSLGRSNNFIRTRAPVVALTGEHETLVWRRETFADVFALATADAPR